MEDEVMTTRSLSRSIKRNKSISDEWYDVRSLVGNDWAMFYIIIGAREAGKSYSVMNFCVNQYKKYNIPFTWMRLSDESCKKMLMGKHVDKFVDADLVRKYDLDLTKNGMDVFDHGKKMAKVISLSTMAKMKGVALFDKDYDGWYNIVCDEFILERSERKTFDVLYNLTNQLENLVRSRKEKVRIFLICNLLEEANDVLTGFNFIPEQFGRYKLKSKRAVIDYVAPTQTYIDRRKGTVADILMPNESTFTNQISMDKALIYKGKLRAPKYVIKFTKDQSDWFTVWDNGIIKEYHNEHKPVIAIRPYLDEIYSPEMPAQVIARFDARAFKFVNLITQKKFQKCLEQFKKRG